MSEKCEGGYNINSMKYSGHYHVMLLGTVIILHYKIVTMLFYSK